MLVTNRKEFVVVTWNASVGAEVGRMGKLEARATLHRIVPFHNFHEKCIRGWTSHGGKQGVGHFQGCSSSQTTSFQTTRGTGVGILVCELREVVMTRQAWHAGIVTSNPVLGPALHCPAPVPG